MDRRSYLVALGALAGCDTGQTESPDRSNVAVETVATGLEVPWGAAWRDGTLYLTERGGRVVRIVDGSVEQVTDFTDSTAARGEGGLLGLEFHPDDPDVAYTYQTYADGGLANRVRRHDVTDDWRAETLLDGVPGASIHDGGRLLARQGELYATCGDASDPANAQERDALAGKVLRLTLDGDPHPDNPFGTAVFTWGHRNPQGLAFRGETLYSTEHGPDTDDEINRLEAGNNYGWPEAKGTGGGEEYTPALAAFTPTIAPGGGTFYDGPIDAWRGDLLFGTLVGTHLHRTRISEDDEVTENERRYQDRFGRLRTTFTGPEGHLYAVTSNRDGRGSPEAEDDRILRFVPA